MVGSPLSRDPRRRRREEATHFPPLAGSSCPGSPTRHGGGGQLRGLTTCWPATQGGICKHHQYTFTDTKPHINSGYLQITNPCQDECCL